MLLMLLNLGFTCVNASFSPHRQLHAALAWVQQAWSGPHVKHTQHTWCTCLRAWESLHACMGMHQHISTAMTAWLGYTPPHKFLATFDKLQYRAH